MRDGLGVTGDHHDLRPGSYVFLPPQAQWTLHNTSAANASFHWIRKAYQRVQRKTSAAKKSAAKKSTAKKATPAKKTSAAKTTTKKATPAKKTASSSGGGS